jgi:hypothetical protein
VTETLPESPALKTLGKGFAECRTRQRELGIQCIGKAVFCRVLFFGHSAKWFAECHRALGKEKQPLRRRVTETASLLSVPGDTRQRSSFAECRPDSTRQRIRQRGSPCQVLCRVIGMTLDKACFFIECHRHYIRQRTYTSAHVLVLCRVL